MSNKNIFGNGNSKKNKRNLKIFMGSTILLVSGAVGLVSCSGCERDVIEDTPIMTTDNLIKQTTKVTTTTTPVVTKEFTTTSTKETKPVTVTSSANTLVSADEEINLETVSPAIVSVTAEEIVALSNSFATYVNKTATLSHENYKFAEIMPEDLYSVVYLANIDSVSKEETSRLISNGIISDNVQNIVCDSFNFYELYADDTINKIAEGKTNIIDLSLILSDKHDIEVAKTMNNIMTGSIKNTKEVNQKNYMDTVFYYAEDVTINNMNYDYSKSIYTSDRDHLTVGADYTLSYAASCIDEISKMNGVASSYYSEIMYNGRVDFSNVVGLFNGCKLQQEITTEKTLVK